MREGDKNELTFVDGIYQQPVGTDVTLAEALVDTYKGVVAMSLLERLLTPQLVEDPVQFTYVQATLLDPFVVLLELRGRN